MLVFVTCSPIYHIYTISGVYYRYGKLENGLIVQVPQALVQRLKQVSEMRSDLMDNRKGQGDAL